MTQSQKLARLLALILAGEAIFMLPFVIPRVFRSTLLEVYQIDNIELGYCYSTYGIVAMLSYFFGGPITDLFPARKLMALALSLTAFGGIVIAVYPGYFALLITYGFWGFSTIFLFWAALMKSTRLLVEPQNEAKAFGWVEGGRGLSSALWASLAVLLFNWFFREEATDQSISRNLAYQNVLIACSALLIIIAIYTYLVLPPKEPGTDVKHSFLAVKKLSKNRGLWLQAAIVLLAYCGYKLTDDLPLYAREVWNYSEKAALELSSSALYIRPLAAVLAGVAADRFKSPRIVLLCFGIGAIGAFFLGFEATAFWGAFSFIWFGLGLAGIYGLRGIYIALMRENGIDRALTGTAVGIVSVIGYLPDIFISPFMGYILENNPGPSGQYYLFRYLGLFMAIGFFIALAWRNFGQKTKPASY
jgi:MFS family permease